jgi:serine protease Do
MSLVEEYIAGRASAARCSECERLVFEGQAKRQHCPLCGAEVTLPSMISDQAPTGVEATIEAIIAAAGYDQRLARRGPCLWSIRRGSATIQLAYHEDSGLLTGDAYLCRLPAEPRAALFSYLLRENYGLEQLTLSTHNDDIILSLLIYDRYLRLDTALPYFEHLFERADAYDNVLVDEYGAEWRTS